MKLLTLNLGTEYQELSAAIVKLANFHDTSAICAYVRSSLGQVARGQLDNMIFR